MAKEYTEELLDITTADGVELSGAVIRPAGKAPGLPIVWVHGFTGSYFEPHALRIGRRLAERGHVFVTGNNRGNNFGTTLSVRATGEQRMGGAAWEKLDESPLDIAAWIDFTLGLGFEQVALVGHSLGGMKATYYMATLQDARVKTLVNASGPVWRFVGPAAPETERIAEAEKLVAEGRGLDLLPPLPETVGVPVSAQRVVGSKRFHEALFGGHGQPRAVSLIRCPVFAFIGTEEAWLGLPSDLEWLKRESVAAPRCETRVIQGADHVYTGHEIEVADAIADWLQSLA
jgi:pimeloyl-ACP methyl ester carboxylesterase